MLRRMRRSIKKKLLYITGGLLLQFFLFSGCIFFAECRGKNRYEHSVKKIEERIRQAERKAFITRREIRPGEAFTEENTEYVTLLSEQDAGLFTTKVAGTFATSWLPAGRLVYVTDCCERSPLEMEKECVFYDVGDVEYFEDFSTVDVRIRYGNGENYCVLKGKKLTKQTEEKNGCSFYLTEEEQLLMSGATYDAETYRGTKLYLVGTKDIVQDRTDCRFLPPLQILLQMERQGGSGMTEDENTKRMRLALEERLAEHEIQRIKGMR